MKTTRLLALALLLLAAPLHAQSLLTEPPETPAQASARAVLAAPAETADVLLGQMADAYSRLWDTPDPQAVLNAMGTKAAAVFAINAAFGQMVSALLTAEGDTERLTRLAALQAKIRPHTIHPDGTVTLNPPEEPEE